MAAMEGNKCHCEKHPEPVTKQPIIFVIGATGCGKSSVAVHAAKTLEENFGYSNVVILNCDVQQFYIGLPIATNKSTHSAMCGIPHVFMAFLSSSGAVCRDPTKPYLPDVSDAQTSTVPLGKPYSIHNFVRDVECYADSYFKANEYGAIVVCGGTPYYFQALLFRNALVNDRPTAEEDTAGDGDELRPRTVVEGGSGDWDLLNTIDPDIAARYHPHDTRRIARLLEIHAKSGLPPSTVQESNEKPVLRYPSERCFVLWVDVDRASLKATLDDRIDGMVQRGLLDEVRSFFDVHLSKGSRVSALDTVAASSSIFEAIGFKEFLPYLYASMGGLCADSTEAQEAICRIKANTRRYARQQCQWIKNRIIRRISACGLVPHNTPDDKGACMGLRHHFVRLDAGACPTAESLKEATQKIISFFFREAAKEDEPLGACPTLIGSFCTFPLTPVDSSGTVASLTGAADRIDSCGALRYEWCELCEMRVFAGPGSMNEHSKTKRHRGSVRRVALVEQQRLQGREIPQRKRVRKQ